MGRIVEVTVEERCCWGVCIVETEFDDDKAAVFEVGTTGRKGAATLVVGIDVVIGALPSFDATGLVTPTGPPANRLGSGAVLTAVSILRFFLSSSSAAA